MRMRMCVPACVRARCIYKKRCKEINETNIQFIAECCPKDYSSGHNENRMRTNSERVGGRVFYDLR